MNIDRVMILPAALTPLARTLAAGLSPAGEGMFVTPLYDATNTITHYISSGWIGEEFGALIVDADALFTACKGAATLAQCNALVGQSIVSDGTVMIDGVEMAEDAHGLIARMGFTLSSGVMP